MLRNCSFPVLALALAAASAAAADRISGPARVIDGDGLRIRGTVVRLYGIDAPELDQICELSGGPWACGRWAKAELEALVAGREVRCTERARDRYGRSVATCTAGGLDLAEAMVRRGAAFAYRAFSADYIAAEKAAMIAGAGLWAAVVTRPAEHRAAARAAASAGTEAAADGEAAAPAGACAVKGNISAAGRIYHLPGQADYESTRIDPARGERWFCSAAEAEASGWRPARR
jgi:endonuclease YncB( thermonuclease family)